MSDSQQPAVRILTQTLWPPDTVILPCDHTLQEGARGRHQLYATRCYSQQAAAARTALWSYRSCQGSTDPGILDWCPGCRLCAGPHPPCPHTPRDLRPDLAQSSTAYRGPGSCTALTHQSPRGWRQSDSVRLLQAATNPGDDVQTLVITSDYKAVTADTDCPGLCSPVTARCKYKKKTKHQPPSRVDYLLILRVNLTRKFAAIKSMF